MKVRKGNMTKITEWMSSNYNKRIKAIEDGLKEHYKPNPHLLEQDEIKNDLIKLLNPGFFEVENVEWTIEKINKWHDPKTKQAKSFIADWTRGYHVCNLEQFKAPKPIEKQFNALMDILNPLQEHFTGVYVHGSYATGGYIEGVSDLDMVYIITDKAARDDSTLFKMRYALEETQDIFKEIDTGDGHGPYILSESMLLNYLESYLPLSVWMRTKWVFGKEHFKCSIVDSAYHNKLWFEKSVLFYQHCADNPDQWVTANDIKKFVLMSTMLPAVAYPWMIGKYTHKAYALEWVQELYPISIPWVKELTRMRAENDFKKPPLHWTNEVCRTIKKSVG